ncbi:MAG: M50 family metallopeptidase [Dactylosporangium sp.]|nr:M50 family metallopeptidase [Dactylosporangium sp.]NNJ61892.1 M50 family metallopeptidase [Dactylosporangium sp.]
MTGIPYGTLAYAPRTAHEPPSTILVACTAILALLLVLAVWPVVRWAITIAHEGGHALFLSALGGSVGSIELGRSKGARGAVNAKKSVCGTSFVLVLLAGYTGPSLFGLLAAILLVQGLSLPVLWLSIVFLVLVLIQVPLRNVFGILAVVTTGAVIFLFARYGGPLTQTVVAHTWIWLLLIGGFRNTVEFRGISRAERRAAKKKEKKKEEGGKKPPKSDAALLHEQTHIPEPFWVGCFLLATLAALLFGGSILLGLVG